MREIITLQLGQQSNYLATHFWNTQDSYFTYGQYEESPVDHDIHFRAGLGADGTETYTPRTVIYDLKGGFGSLKKLNALYEIDEDAAPQGLWGGKTVVQRQQPIEPSSYQQSLDAGTAPPELNTSSVRYWSDFNRVFYHPMSIIQLNEYELNSTLLPFEKWTMGEELFSSLDKDHDIVDRDLRPFVEEADHMQGIQVMAGIDDAWGGFAAKYIECLRDEYGKSPIWVWGLQEPTIGVPRAKRLLRLVNKARAITDIYSQASLLIPLSIPQRLPASVALDYSSPWHVSALFGAALESTSLYTRLRTSDLSNSTSLGQVTDMLNVFGKQTIANLQMSIVSKPSPDQSGNGKMFVAGGRGELAARMNELSYEDEEKSDSESQDGMPALDVNLSSLEENITYSAGFRGKRKRHLFSRFNTSRGNESTDKSDKTGISVEDQDRARARRRPKNHSYPWIFRHRNGMPDKESVSIRTVLSTDSSVTDKMKGLRSTVVRSIGLEDREDIGNELAEIAEGYKEGWSSGSDDDDDED